jgi:peptidoglycan/xylan/chitin deacetylase (PgdA/CDA1 family)
MNKFPSLLILLVCILPVMLSGCRLNIFAKHHPATVAKVSAPVAPKPLPVDFASVRPNEDGAIPILEYHQLIPDTDKVSGYKYHIGEFRKDMNKLYELGYRPVGLSDVLNGKIDCPAGCSPVVLTFDDSLPGQLDYDDNGKISPDCAVGVLMAMHQEHPDWPLKGTFFVLPRRGYKDYFFQPEYSQAKLQWLAANGFELGNHTIHHLMGIRDWPDDKVEAEFAQAKALIDQNVPGYKVDTLALPYGVYPMNHKLVVSGQSAGVSYFNICALRAGAGPSDSPISKRFKPYYMPRIIPGGERFALQFWLTYLQKHPIKRYISDGDPNTFTVPAILAADVDPAKLKATGCMERTY